MFADEVALCLKDKASMRERPQQSINSLMRNLSTESLDLYTRAILVTMEIGFENRLFQVFKAEKGPKPVM